MNMIEKVARAVEMKRADLQSQPLQRIYDELAKAAIAAMREPTEEMLKAFYGTTPVENWLGDDWRDMIDAALKE